MKYKVGDKTLLGEIDEIDTTADVIFPYRIRNDITRRRKWFTESEIDTIICKPKRNIDRIEELWFNEEKCEASELWTNLLEKRSSMIKTLFEPYEEPNKYPKLTPEELKAVKWLIEGGFIAIDLGGAIKEFGENNGLDHYCVKYLPLTKILYSSKWLKSEPIDLNELIKAQESFKHKKDVSINWNSSEYWEY